MDLPTAEPPRASSRKRTATSLAADSELDAGAGHRGDEPAKKKRAPRSTAAEKQAKKVARMERNRLAAQVSRDKKRQEAELLAKRVAELEAQLVVDSPSTAPSTLSASPSFALPPTPASLTTALPTTTTTRDALVERLQDENESLKTQLALEQLQSQSLQIRLSSLEAKFGRLEQLLSHANTGHEHGATEVKHEHDGGLDSTAPTAEVGSMETDSSRLVAREDDISLPRKLSHPSFLPLPPTPSTSRPSPVPAPTSTSTSTRSSASTLAPRPSMRPSLHQILSAITVPSTATTCPTTSSRKPGSTGRAGSTSAPSRRRTRASRQLQQRRYRLSRSASSTCSSSCVKTRVVRLKLSVRR